jgi:hypothetical protein
MAVKFDSLEIALLVDKFKKFDGDSSALDFFEKAAANCPFVQGGERLHAGERQTFKTCEDVAGYAEKLSRVGVRERDRRSLRRRLLAAYEKLTGRSMLPGSLDEIKEYFRDLARQMKEGVSLLRQGRRVASFQEYFLLAALVPYTELVSGKPQWGWIENYLYYRTPGRKYFNAWETYKKMLKACTAADTIISKADRIEQVPDTDGLAIYLDTFAPNYCKAVRGAVSEGAHTFLAFVHWRQIEGKKNRPLALGWKLSPDEKECRAIVKKRLSFLSPSLDRWGKPVVKTLTKRQRKQVDSLQKSDKLKPGMLAAS